MLVGNVRVRGTSGREYFVEQDAKGPPEMVVGRSGEGTLSGCELAASCLLHSVPKNTKNLHIGLRAELDVSQRFWRHPLPRQFTLTFCRVQVFVRITAESEVRYLCGHIGGKQNVTSCQVSVDISAGTEEHHSVADFPYYA